MSIARLKASLPRASGGGEDSATTASQVRNGASTSAQIVSGNDSDGTTTIRLTWTPPTDSGTEIAIYRKGFGFYPEYDDAAAAPPWPATLVDAREREFIVQGVVWLEELARTMSDGILKVQAEAEAARREEERLKAEEEARRAARKEETRAAPAKEEAPADRAGERSLRLVHRDDDAGAAPAQATVEEGPHTTGFPGFTICIYVVPAKSSAFC